jgi:16S rRNA (cytidine1402-2'-O)-methyltransferase
MGTLYLVATPIGNLEDITHRAVRVMKEARLIAAEDTRQTAKLLRRYAISTPLISYHEHNEQKRKERLLEELAAGDVALVSDAGTPGLSDPGYDLVQAALRANHAVVSIPGPSAPITALVASGLPTDAFIFLGYLPRRAGDRRRLLQEVAAERRTLVAFEAPHRLRRALADIESILGGNRPVAICRELTKVHEQILRGPLREMRRHFEEKEPRGEFTLVISGLQAEGAWDERAVRAAIARELEQGCRPSQAAQRVAAEAGWSRKDVYRLILEDK